MMNDMIELFAKKLAEEYGSEPIKSDDIVTFLRGFLQDENISLNVLSDGSFTAREIREAYSLGRAHEKNSSDCTGVDIEKAWLRADILNRTLNWK